MPTLNRELSPSQVSTDTPFRVVYQSPDPNGWAIATFTGQGRESVGLCWNTLGRLGRARLVKASDWFILPAEIAGCVLTRARELRAQQREFIAKEYEEQAADVDREAEALEWCDALIGDAYVADAEEG